MSIRLIAKDLYDLIKKVEKLEKRIEDAPPDKRDRLMDDLRKLKAERNQMRRILDGEKNS